LIRRLQRPNFWGAFRWARRMLYVNLTYALYMYYIHPELLLCLFLDKYRSMANRGGAPKRYPSNAKQSRFVKQIIRSFGSAKHKQSSSQTDIPKLLITPSSTMGPRGSKDAQPGQNLGAIVNHQYASQYNREAFYNACPSNVEEKVRKLLTTESSRLGISKIFTYRKFLY